MTENPLLGIIPVLTTGNPDLRDAHGRAITAEHGVRTVSRCIPDQPHGIHDPASHANAIPKIVDVARNLTAEGASALMISCTADPGLAQTRAAVSVPVWGAGSSAAAVATAVGGRVGVLGITENVPAAMAEMLGNRLVAHRRPEGVTRTTDLITPRSRAAALRSVGELVAAGAQVVLFACTGLTTIDLAVDARARWNVPVIDAVRATGALAALAMG